MKPRFRRGSRPAGKTRTGARGKKRTNGPSPAKKRGAAGSRTRRRRGRTAGNVRPPLLHGSGSAYREGYHAGFVQGFEDGHQLAYEQQL